VVAFTIGKPVTTDTPVVEVDAGLAVGSHRFQLVVVDDNGLRSKPDEIVVLVRGRIVLDPPIVVTRPPIADPVIDPAPPVAGPVTGPVVRPPVVVGPAVDPVRPPITGPAINPAVIGTVVRPVSPVIVRDIAPPPAPKPPKPPKADKPAKAPKAPSKRKKP